MSTEKSLLKFTDVKLPKLTNKMKHDGLYLPVGVTPGGHVETVHLSHTLRTSHAIVMGCAGSGKSKFVECVIKSLCAMYGTDIMFSYLDGKCCEVQYWVKSDLQLNYLLCGCPTVEDLKIALEKIVKRIETKSKTTPDLVVIDDVSDLIEERDPAVHVLMHRIYAEGSRKNVQMLYATQNPGGSFIRSTRELRDTFGLVCTTRVGVERSNDIFGSLIASYDGGMRKYGDLVYSYNGAVSKVRVPYCSYHD